MNSRERTLAIVLAGLLLVGGLFGGYVLVLQPLQEKTSAANKLRGEIDDLQAKVDGLRKNAPRLADAKRRSLPADPTLARQEYTEALSRLVRKADVAPGFTITEKTADAKGVPLLPGPGKKPAYARIAYEVAFEHADMWAVHDFLTGYYRLGVLHQITHLDVKRDETPVAAGGRRAPGGRKDLSVKLTTEAVILDGAEPRRTLLPVSNAFAAVGGLPGYNTIALNPEAGRGLTPLQFAPVLAPRRDYALIVQKDIFHGPLSPPDPLKLGKIGDVTAALGEAIPPVKVPVTGHPEYLGRVTLSATADGKFLPSGSVKVDEKAGTVAVTPPPGVEGSSTVTVVAKASNGQEAKASFKVSVAAPKDDRPDIADVVKLIIVGTRSDGTAFATIRDNANRATYEIEATPKGVKVTKFFYVREKKKDPFYDTPDLLVIADDSTKTNRRFRVVSVDADGLVLADLTPTATAPAPGAKGPARKGPTAGGGRSEPLEVVVGSAAAAGGGEPPALLRWEPGKSLAALTPVSRGEARKILERAASAGPVGSAAVATGN